MNVSKNDDGQNSRLKVVASNDIEVGQCVVMMGSKIVYSGRIGLPLIRFIKSGVTLVLHPVDFKDGEAFRKQFN